MLYRIMTENVNRDAVEAIASKRFDAFTAYEATGYWQGTREASLVLEFIGDASIHGAVREVALEIKVANRQQAVLVEALQNESELV